MQIGGIVLYMIIGGFLMGYVDKQSVKYCGDHLPFTYLTTGIIAWPGLFPASMITEKTGDLCDND